MSSALAISALAGLLLVLASRGPVRATPARLERMLVSQTRSSDLEGSASGYAYDQRQGVPVSYVQYTSHTGGLGSPGLQPLYNDYQPGYASYNAYPYQSYPAYEYEGELPPPLAPYYPVQVLQRQGHYEEPYHHQGHLGDLGHLGHSGHLPHLHHHHGVEESSEEEAGASHQAEDNSAHGERGEKAYGTHHDFDQGENEHREKDYQQGEYEDEAGHEAGHEESDSQYDAHDKAEAAEEGANYGNKAYQKKGHRTSGFHNVYRKDEYKKDTDFYDEDHDGGHYEKYGAFDAHHKDEEGGYEKGGKHGAGYQQARHGQKGHFDKGQQHSAHKGHKGAEGEDTYREEHADFASKAGKHHSNEHGYKQGHGYR